MSKVFEGKFKKVRYKNLSGKFGMYRWAGKVTIDDNGITLQGWHVRSVAERWCIGIILVVFSFILTGGAAVLGVIPIYLLVEYCVLVREDINVPWTKRIKYIIDPKRKIVGFRFDGPKWTSPAFIYTEQFEQLADELHIRAFDKDVAAGVIVSP